MIELLAGDASATIVPAAGGRIGSLNVEGTDLVVTGGPQDPPTKWGAFPMAPWAGRLRDGRFTHDGITHQLAVDAPPHAIHGTVATREWSVVEVTEHEARLACELGDGWPLGGRAEQWIRLTADALRCTLRVVAADRSMPVALGWHVWFRTAGPAAVAARLMYERGPDHMPTGRVVPLRPPPWDDCFLTSEPVHVPVGPFDVAVVSDCTHVVVCDEPTIGVAVEPQSGPPDALNLEPRTIAPGGVLERSMTITWRPVRPTGR